METLIARVTEVAEPIYRGSTFYKYTIWAHALAVAGFAKDLAARMGANQVAAQLAGLLHDVGAAKFGKEDHHITGAAVAAPILLSCGCPLDIIGLILRAIYAHRGSQQLGFWTPEDRCVAAADAIDHFENLEELWLVQTRDLGALPITVFQTLSSKLERDWQKTHSEIRALLDGAYSRARRKLVMIANGEIIPRERSCAQQL